MPASLPVHARYSLYKDTIFMKLGWLCKETGFLLKNLVRVDSSCDKETISFFGDPDFFD